MTWSVWKIDYSQIEDCHRTAAAASISGYIWVVTEPTIKNGTFWRKYIPLNMHIEAR
jgi:hypothetical protein